MLPVSQIQANNEIIIHSITGPNSNHELGSLRIFAGWDSFFHFCQRSIVRGVILWGTNGSRPI